ncbi:MAG TPA: neutral zinc metallopeptidase [Allosphingosinicella sp.]|nr:neutral zinc metallopeptidase [Allosphingosinicella sp.]
MRFGGRRTSSNVEGRSGGGFGFGGGGGLGGGGGMLLGLVFSRFGIGGVVVLFLLMMFLGGNPLGLSESGQQTVAPHQVGQAGSSAAEQCASDPAKRFLCQVLASTEDRWAEMFTAQGSRYTPPTLVFYPGQVQSGCGTGRAEMGPFYCPADQRIFLDTSFLEELARRFAAPGDFAQAYVVAHEVGHHVQTITGTAEAIRRAQSGARESEANALQVRMELQADCYAGVWAARERIAMEPGDLEEGMAAAAAIGDDTLQRAGQGYVVPESFTHGTAAQRQEALMRGYRGGSPAACEQYTAGL